MLHLGTVMDSDRQQDQEVALVNALAKGLDLLSIFATGELLGNQQIAQRTGMAKATVSRLTTTLSAMGYLRFDADARKYAIGSRLMAVSACVQHRLGLFSVARLHMRDFVEATGVTVGLGARDRLGMVSLDVVRPEGPILGTATVGTVWPIASTAIGLSYLAEAPLKERTHLLKQLQLRHGTEWPRLRQTIYEAMLQSRQQGFVLRTQSCETEVCAAAVSIYLPSMNGIFSFNCAMRSQDLDGVRQLQSHGQRLHGMVQAIARDLQNYTQDVALQ